MRSQPRCQARLTLGGRLWASKLLDMDARVERGRPSRADRPARVFMATGRTPSPQGRVSRRAPDILPTGRPLTSQGAHACI